MCARDDFTITNERFEDIKDRYFNLLITGFNKATQNARNKEYVHETYTWTERFISSQTAPNEDMYYMGIVLLFEQRYNFGDDINDILGDLLIHQSRYLKLENEKNVFMPDGIPEIKQLPFITSYKPGKMYLNRFLIRYQAKKEFANHLKKHKEVSGKGGEIPDLKIPKSKNYTKNQQAIAMYFILREFNLKEEKGFATKSDIARFLHLISAEPFSEVGKMDNSNIYKACKTFLTHTEKKNIEDLEFVLEKFQRIAPGSRHLNSIIGKIKKDIEANKEFQSQDF